MSPSVPAVDYVGAAGDRRARQKELHREIKTELQRELQTNIRTEIKRELQRELQTDLQKEKKNASQIYGINHKKNYRDTDFTDRTTDSNTN